MNIRADDGPVELADVSEELAVIGLWGPRSREVLQAVTDDDVSNGALPFRSARDLAIGPAPALAQRITYVGELGYELYVPPEWAAQVVGSAPRGRAGLRHRRPPATASWTRCAWRRGIGTTAPT